MIEAFLPLVHMWSTNVLRAAGVTIMMCVTLALLIWVSLIDVKKQSITFWKMLLSSSMVILGPSVISLFYTCEALSTMKGYLWSAFGIWIFLLFLNIKLNRDRFMGKADIDLLSAILAVGISYSMWLRSVSSSDGSVLRIAGFWYSVLGWLLLGALVYLAIFLLLVFKRVIRGGCTVKQLLHDTRISIIPMFIPVSVMTPYIIAMS